MKWDKNQSSLLLLFIYSREKDRQTVRKWVWLPINRKEARRRRWRGPQDTLERDIESVYVWVGDKMRMSCECVCAILSETQNRQWQEEETMLSLALVHFELTFKPFELNGGWLHPFMSEGVGLHFESVSVFASLSHTLSLMDRQVSVRYTNTQTHMTGTLNWTRKNNEKRLVFESLKTWGSSPSFLHFVWVCACVATPMMIN